MARQNDLRVKYWSFFNNETSSAALNSRRNYWPPNEGAVTRTGSWFSDREEAAGNRPDHLT
jgi:hypothetical protein